MIKRKNIPDIDMRSEEERTLDILLESGPPQSCQEISDWIIDRINSIKEKYLPQMKLDINPNLASLYCIEARPRIIPIEGYQDIGTYPVESFQRKMPLGNNGAYRILPVSLSCSEDF